MADSREIVFLLDIDNTLIDHDELKRRVGAWIDREAERGAADEFWRIYEAVREELDIVDFLESARRFGQLIGGSAAGVALTAFLWDHPFEELLLPGARDGWRHLSRLGKLAVLCDGEAAFQCRKLQGIGLLPLLSEVFVFDHKEQHLAEVEAIYPGASFVMFDDKARLLDAAASHFDERLTTVQVAHGRHAEVGIRAHRRMTTWEAFPEDIIDFSLRGKLVIGRNANGRCLAGL